MLAFRESAGRADSQEKKRIIRHAFGYSCRAEPMNRLIEWFIRECKRPPMNTDTEFCA